MSPDTKNNWLKGKVIKGAQLGRKLGFPTINLDNPEVMAGFNPGVYASKVKIEGKIYKGLLYYGPKFIQGETKNALEIYILDFDKEIYGQEVVFQITNFIRPPIKFSDLDLLKKQMNEDLSSVLNKL